MSEQIHTEIEVPTQDGESIGIEHYSGNKGIMFYISIADGESINWTDLYNDDIDRVIELLQRAKGLINGS